MSKPNFQAHPPSPDQDKIFKEEAELWRKIRNESPIQGLVRVEEAAKQIIGITGLLQGLYFAAYTFSNINEQLSGLNNFLRQIILPAFFLPALAWLISLFCATQVFVPRMRLGANRSDISVGAWQNIRDTYEIVLEEKLKWLQRAHQWLVSSFCLVLVLLFLLTFLPEKPKAEPERVVILTPTPMATASAIP